MYVIFLIEMQNPGVHHTHIVKRHMTNSWDGITVAYRLKSN